MTWCLRSGEIVDKFLTDLHRLAWELLPDRWIVCAFVSGLLHVRQLLRASSQMDAMNLEQFLTRAKAIMINDGGCEMSATASVGWPHSDAEVPSSIQHSGTVICYKCSGPNHMARNCMVGGVRWSTEIQLWTTVFLMQSNWAHFIRVPGKCWRGDGVSASLLPEQVKN